jgi:isoquinoline 1-oxidoreductase beta subunit
VPGVFAVVGIPGSSSGIDKGAWGRIRPELASAQDRFAAISPGVAVLAKDTWSAIKGREVLAPKIVWDESQAERRSTEDILAEYRRLAAEPLGLSAIRRGEGNRALGRSRSIVEHDSTFPYLAHAPMEPVNAVLEKKPGGSVEIWAGSQFPTIDTWMTALALGISHEQVKLNTVWAGGSFGRRATPNADYINELAHIVRASGTNAPVHLVWTREDDIRGGRYRPMMFHRVRAGLDNAGKLLAWEHRMVGQSFISGTLLELKIPKLLLAPMAEEGVPNMAYEIPNLAAGWQRTSLAVPTLWWRSVSNSHTAYVVDVMIDALANAAGRDPIEFRLDLLAKHPRHVAVLKLARDRSGFGEKLPTGRGRGIAVHESFNTVVAMVADVIVDSSASITVKKVTAAVDCGIAINPDIVRAQIEGSVGFALGAALRNEITLDAGRVKQSNFHDYEPLRISDMPDVEVHIVDHSADPKNHPPRGIGEPGVPPVAPAVANAIFAATGKRLYALPWDSAALRSI